MILFVCVLSVILSVLVAVNNWNINRASIFLSLLLIVISIFSLNHHFMAEGGSVFWLAIFYNNFAPLWYLAGPLLLWYTRSIIKDEIRFYKSDIIHLLPFVAHLIGVIPYLFTSFDYKLKIAAALLRDSSQLKTINVNWLIPIEVNLVARPALLALYCIYSFLIFRNHLHLKTTTKSELPETHSQQVARWYYASTLILLAVSINYMVAGIQFLKAPVGSGNIFNLPIALFSSFLIAILPTMILVFPEVLYGLPRMKKQRLVQYENSNGPELTKKGSHESGSSNVNAESYFKDLSFRIIETFEKDKIFVNPELSVDDVAEKFSVPRHHIYYCLNSILGKKFTSLKNSYRVYHAQELLLEMDLNKFTIDSIGLRSGFASRSSFYSAFKEITGITPSEFLAQHGKSESAK